MSLLLALALASCNPGSNRDTATKRGPRSAAPTGSHTIEATLEGGWISVTLSLPQRPPGPKPVVIHPIVDDRVLLARGIGVVRFRTRWEVLREMRGFDPAAQSGASSPARGDAVDPSSPAAAAPSSPADGAGTPAGESVAAPGPPALPVAPTKVGAWLLAAPRPGIVGKAYFDLISTDASNVSKVVDFLLGLPQVDPSRIAISGSSTSGFMALQALTLEPRLAVGVVRVACGDYFAFLRQSSLALNGDPRWLPEGRMELDPDYAATLRSIQPIAHADHFPPRPLLLLAGDEDRAIPIACVEATAKELSRTYAARGEADRFRFVVFPGRGHDLGDDSQAEALAWLERWLLRTAGAAPVARNAAAGTAAR